MRNYGVKGALDAESAAERIRSDIAELQVILEVHEIPVTVSIGVVVAHSPSQLCVAL